MALLTTKPYDTQNQIGWLLDALKIAQQAKESEARLAQARQEALMQDERRRMEFAATMGFNQQREAEDTRRYNSENAPIPVLGGGQAPSAVAMRGIPAVEPPLPTGGPTSTPPIATTPTSSPVVTEPAAPDSPSANLPAGLIVRDEREEATTPTETAPADVAPEPTDLLATPNLNLPGESMAPSKQAIQVADRARRATVATAPANRNELAGPLPAAGPVSPAEQVVNTIAGVQKLGIPVTRKTLQSALPSMLTTAIAGENRRLATTSPQSSEISSFPVNERGYRFDPQNPERMFMERATPKGSTFTQIKTTDPGYGLLPAGEGLFEDKNGARFFIDGIKKGVPNYKRVEEDLAVKRTAKDTSGRIHSYNQFGEEVGITDPKFDFLTPKSKLLIGSDSEVYAFDDKGKPLSEIPAGVTFGANKDAAKKFLIGSDGKPYGLKEDGTPVTPIPEGVRFDKPKDELAVAHWEVDKQSGDLHGFNFKGQKIAATEGEYRMLRSNAEGKAPTMTESAKYETLAPPVKALNAVYDEIRAAGLSPHASHPELVEKLGSRGTTLSDRRSEAQKVFTKLKLPGGAVSRDYAEGFVRSYERRTSAGGLPSSATPASTAQATPAGSTSPAPVAPAPAPAPVAPVVAPAPVAAPAQGERIATNPTTGQKLVFRNGAWVPLTQ